jgi:hypothetical protein
MSESRHRHPVVVVVDEEADGCSEAQAARAAFTVGLDWSIVDGGVEPAPPVDAPPVGKVTPWSFRQLR